ncbi:MAG: hypothetical protein OQK73_10840 [Gammaproteobacteria bacterium]|nr:hypothetical protein [Gammaproteobacteria bacterium]
MNSYIDYLAPTGANGSSPVRLPIPQACICFKKGVSVTKRYEPLVTGNKVEIEVSNVDLNPVSYVEVAEFPTGFAEASSVDDDFGFKPLRMLLNNRVIPWFTELVERHAKETYPGYEQLPSSVIRQIKKAIRSALDLASEPLRVHEGTIDKYLCQFQFHEITPEPANLEDYWSTVNQRGIYKLITKMPPLSKKSIQFQVNGASYLYSSDSSIYLPWYVDARYPKWGVNHTMSWYKAANSIGEQMIEPNPPYSQIASSDPLPDLFTSTCFNASDTNRLYALFSGAPHLNRPWDMLDSVDIKQIWRQQGRTRGVSINVHNCGDSAGRTRLHVKSYYIPFTGSELQVDVTARSFEFTPVEPFYGTGDTRVFSIGPRTSISKNITYHNLVSAGSGAPVNDSFLATIRNAIVITIVDLDADENELVLANNRGIEIVPLFTT